MVPMTPYLFPSESTVFQSYDPTLEFYSSLTNLPSPQTPPSGYEFNQQPSSSSNNSLLTFDEAEEEQVKLIDQKKQRRMISNRESARRSRVRKRMHLDELMSQLMQAQKENHDLVYKLKHVTDCHDQVLEENSKIKEEVSEIRKLLSSVQVDRPCTFLEGFSEDC